MMNTSAPIAESPSKTKLLQATAIAIAIALVLLFTAVLPAEYGIDPLGAGKALGLNGLAAAGAGASALPAGGEAAGPVVQAPTIKGVFVAQPKGYKIDSREIKLESGEGIEIKYHMEQGAGMVYSWTASPREKIFYEFHGEPDVKPAGKAGTDYFESYELNDKTGGTEGHGTFVAPSTGIHGWFWENKSDKPVTLKVVSSGFFDWIMQNRKNKHTALKPMDLGSLPRHPAVPDEAVK